jgi:protein TonB
VLADPGHGFGAAAVACALRTRFVPARARSGQAVRSLSPPIRVRFTR